VLGPGQRRYRYCAIGRNVRTSFIICVPPKGYQDLSAITIKRNIERIASTIQIDTPFWGVGGSLWIPVNDDAKTNGTPTNQRSSNPLEGAGICVWLFSSPLALINFCNQTIET
jgi:hypothetical protein